MQEHTSRCSPGGDPFGMFLLARCCELRIKVLMLRLAVANPRGGASQCDAGLRLSRTAFAQQVSRPVALHLMRQRGCLAGCHVAGRSFMAARFPACGSTCSCPSRNVPPLRHPRSILKLSHAGAWSIPARAPRRRQGTPALVRVPCCARRQRRENPFLRDDTPPNPQP